MCPATFSRAEAAALLELVVLDAKETYEETKAESKSLSDLVRDGQSAVPPQPPPS